MRYIELGQGTCESIPVIGLGTYHLLDRMDEDRATAAVIAAQAVGIDFVDTSDNYMNEQFLGRVIAESDAPEQFFVATKTGLATTYEEFVAMRSEGRSADTSPERVKEQLAKSLGALQTNVVDLYQLHSYDDQTPAEDTAVVMNELIDDGYIKFYGVSNYSREELVELLDACDRLGLQRPTTIQPYLNLLSTHVHDQGVDLAREEGLVVLAHSPLMKGFLTDASVDAFDAALGRERQNGDHDAEVIDKWQEANNEVQRLKEYANRHGYNLSEYALAWLVNQPATVAINACVKPEHLQSSLRAADWALDREGMVLADEVRSNPVVVESAPVMFATANAARKYYAKKSK